MTGTRAVIAAVVVALGLAGCSSEDPEPKLTPTSPSASPSSTPSETGPVEPTMPAAAKGTDAAAAEAFVEFYFDTVNYAQASGDVGALEALARLCSGCESGTKSIVQTYANGGRIIGGDGSPRRFAVGFLDREPRDWATVECTVVTTKQTIDLPGSSDDEKYPAGSTDVRLLVEPTPDGWVVRSLVTR